MPFKGKRRFSVDRNMPRGSSAESDSPSSSVPNSPQGLGALSRASLSADDSGNVGTFVAKGKSKIRERADMDSRVVGDLEKGTVIEALELKTVGSVVRVRYKRGWVSMSSTKTSKMLLQPLEHLSFAGAGAGAVLPGVEESDSVSLSEEESSRSPSRSPVGPRQRASPPELDLTGISVGADAETVISPLGVLEAGQPLGESGIKRSKSSEDLLSVESPPRPHSPDDGLNRLTSAMLVFTFEACKGKDGKDLPLGIGWAPRTSEHMALSVMRQSRFGDDCAGDMIIVQEIRPDSLAAMQGPSLTEGLVLVEIQQESVVGKSYAEFLGLFARHMDARPLELKFRHDEEEQEQHDDFGLYAIPFVILASQTGLLGLEFGSQLEGFGDTAEHVVVIKDVKDGALTTVYKGETCTLQRGMVLQGVSGQPVGGRTFDDVQGMIYQALLVSQIAHKEEVFTEEFAEQEASGLIREMGSRGRLPPPPAPPTPIPTPDGEKLIRPAPPRPHRMCNGELVALPGTSAGAYVLEFDAVAVRSTDSTGGFKLTPRILKPQLSIEVTSKEPLGIELVEVECPQRGKEDGRKVVVVSHLDYSSKATRKLEDQGLTEGMVLCEVQQGSQERRRVIPAAAENIQGDELIPYTLSEVAEIFKVGLRPLVLSFEGEFDEASETSHLAPRLVDPKVAMQTSAMQKTFDVKRGSMSKLLKLQLGDMGIQVETKDSRDEKPSWDSFHYKNLENGKVQVRGRKLYIRIAASGAARQAPVVLTCIDNQAKEIQQLVDIKIRELRKADRYNRLRAKEALRAAESIQYSRDAGLQPTGYEALEPDPELQPESELELEPHDDASAEKHGSVGEKHGQDGATSQTLEQTRIDSVDELATSGSPPRISPLVPPLNLATAPSFSNAAVRTGADSPDANSAIVVARASSQTPPSDSHKTPRSLGRSLGEMAANARVEATRLSVDSMNSPMAGSTAARSPTVSPTSRTPPSATAAAAAANGNGWGSQGPADVAQTQTIGRTGTGSPASVDVSSDGRDEHGQNALAEGVPPSPTSVISKFPALAIETSEWTKLASTPTHRSLYEVPDFEQPRLLATKMRLCATTVADITARALEDVHESGMVAAPIVARAEAYVAAVIYPAQQAMLRDLKDYIACRGALRHGHSGAIATSRGMASTAADMSSGPMHKLNLFELGVHLVTSHLIRPVAPSVEDFFSDSEDEDNHEDSNDGFDYSAPMGSRGAVVLPSDPQWPTLSLVYEFACRFFMSHDISAEDAEDMLCRAPTADDGGAAHGQGQGRRLISQLVPLLEYAGEKERVCLIRLLKLLVNKFGSTKHKKVVTLLLQSTASACATLAYESCNSWSSCGYGRHRGLSELLDLSLTLISRWRAPLLRYQEEFVVRWLGALHTLPAERLGGCHEALKECQFTAIEKAGAAGGEIAVKLLGRCLLRRWPRQSVDKQVLFLEEMEGLLPHVPPSELLTIGSQLGEMLSVCLLSPHVDVVLGALYLITAEDVEVLFSNAAAEVATERQAGDSDAEAVATIEKQFKSLAALVAAADLAVDSDSSSFQEASGGDEEKSVATIANQVNELFDTLKGSVNAVLMTSDVAHCSSDQRIQIAEMAEDAANMLGGLIDECDLPADR
eukprot:COSAG02_NODE_1969_length_10226_cov_4.961292_2_plen_1627_part_00